jgi:FkbM family methyltransferase
MSLFQSRSTSARPLHLFDLGALLSKPRTENEAVIRGLCNVAYLGEDTALARALGRYKMFVDTSDVGFSSHLMLDGYWEMWVTEEICRRIRPGMIVADIGANLGYFSLLMAELVGPEGAVHAFEPNPRMAERLRMSLDVNGFGARSTIHEIALGATDGEPMTFVIPPHEPKNAHLTPFNGTLPAGGTLLHTGRLDSIPESARIEFAKIDVEGAEELIWSGAERLLQGNALRTVVLEFTAGRYQDAAAFLDRVLAPGFALSYIDPWQGVTAISQEALLARNPSEDVMLLLER